jgi:hypothetical protein
MLQLLKTPLLLEQHRENTRSSYRYRSKKITRIAQTGKIGKPRLIRKYSEIETITTTWHFSQNYRQRKTQSVSDMKPKTKKKDEICLPFNRICLIYETNHSDK